eukprot:gene18414-24888_t
MQWKVAAYEQGFELATDVEVPLIEDWITLALSVVDHCWGASRVSRDCNDMVLSHVANTCKSLANLSTAGCRDIGDEGVSHLTSCSQLKSMDLSGCTGSRAVRTTGSGFNRAPSSQRFHHTPMASGTTSWGNAGSGPGSTTRGDRSWTEAGSSTLHVNKRLRPNAGSGGPPPSPARGLRSLTLNGLQIGDLTLQATSGLASLSLCGCKKVTDTGALVSSSRSRCLQRLGLPRGCCNLRMLAWLPLSLDLDQGKSLFLQHLDLANAATITDSIITSLACQCPCLRTLSLKSAALLTDASLSALAVNCQLLSKLVVTGSRHLTDTSLALSLGLPGITSLDLSGCCKVAGSYLLSYLDSATLSTFFPAPSHDIFAPASATLLPASDSLQNVPRLHVFPTLSSMKLPAACRQDTGVLQWQDTQQQSKIHFQFQD